VFVPQCDLRITNAALGDQLADASARTSVKVTYNTPVKVDEDDNEDDENGPEPLTTTVLCSLTPGKVCAFFSYPNCPRANRIRGIWKIEQATIDLIVEEDEELTFEAVGKK
jgi:FK506-binding nuclear protein